MYKRVLFIVCSVAVALAVVLTPLTVFGVIDWSFVSAVFRSDGGRDNIVSVNGLDGSTGPAGKDGQDGANGIDGRDGQDGVNGADGRDGKDGQDGVNGADGRDGKDGQDGVNGADGRDGQDGANGIDGKDGVNGVDGRDGQDGVNGADGRDGQDGQDGANGADGRDGKDGANGIDGKDGVNGTDGRDGQDGANGIDGKDGVNGVDGRDGKDGQDGANGIDGRDGANGRDGTNGALGWLPVSYTYIEEMNACGYNGVFSPVLSVRLQYKEKIGIATFTRIKTFSVVLAPGEYFGLSGSALALTASGGLVFVNIDVLIMSDFADVVEPDDENAFLFEYEYIVLFSLSGSSDWFDIELVGLSVLGLVEAV